MSAIADLEGRLADWLRTQLPDADTVRVEGLDRLTFGHSAELIALTVVSVLGTDETRQDVVLRLRPAPPALLEPYDLPRQFAILRALESTSVRVPRALWLEPSGEVLGRPFLVMARVDGDVYEMDCPTGLSDETVAAMCHDLVAQLAAIHAVDLDGTGLSTLDDGDHLDRELARWAGEQSRVAKGPLPALERLHAELRRTKPRPHPRVTLVHGDAKPGNFAFTDGAVSAVFDWELTTVGDPLTDIGWLELLWMQPVGLTSHPAALTVDQLLEAYQSVSGVTVAHRPWYRALNAYKMAVICLIGAMLVDDGHSDDHKLVIAAYGTSLLTTLGLSELGVDEKLDDGPIMPSAQRMQAVAPAR